MPIHGNRNSSITPNKAEVPSDAIHGGQPNNPVEGLNLAISAIVQNAQTIVENEHTRNELIIAARSKLVAARDKYQATYDELQGQRIACLNRISDIDDSLAASLQTYTNVMNELAVTIHQP